VHRDLDDDVAVGRHVGAGGYAIEAHGGTVGRVRDGRSGALVMGVRHGVFCLGCCWALMALLFVGGVMNLAWVATLTVFVLIEKVVPTGRIVPWVSGGLLLAWAAWLAARALT
jgi:predicted metal-binding membrane protein